MKIVVSTVACVALGLAGITASTVGFAGAAQAAASGGGVCIVDHVYVDPNTYTEPKCTCPSGSVMTYGNNTYVCRYTMRQTHGAYGTRARAGKVTETDQSKQSGQNKQSGSPK